MARARRTRLGWLGPAIVLVGAAVASVGVWYFVHARPVVGDVVDEISIDKQSRFILRNEAGGDRTFVELWSGDTLRWQALVPPYVGSPQRRAIAWSPIAVTLRVDRGGRAEVFALAMQDAAKLGGFRLAPEHEPNHVEPDGPITLTDHVRSYEFVGGAGWHQVVAVDLATGKARWKVELGAEPVGRATLMGATLFVYQGDHRRALSVENGSDVPGAIDFQF